MQMANINMMQGTILLLVLSSCCLLHGVRACGPELKERGLQVKLDAINAIFGPQNPVKINETLYFLDLCSPLNLTANCTKSSVCVVQNMTAGETQYMSYGTAGSGNYSVQNSALQDNTQNVSVNITYPLSAGVTRQTVVRLLCNAFDNDTAMNITITNSAADHLDVLVVAGHQCVFNSTGASTTTSSTTPPTSTPSSSTTFPTPTPSSTTTPPTSTPAPSSNKTTPSTSTPAPSSNATTPSPTTTSTMPTNSTTPPVTSSQPSILNSTSVPSQPNSTQTTAPMNTSSAPMNTSSAPSPSNAPSCDDSCERCSQTLALALGVSVPATAIIAFLVALLIFFCCFKVKKRRSYIRLGPTTHFDEEPEDED